MNKTLAIAGQHYVLSYHKAWDLHVFVLTFALHTSMQEITKFSPSELVYRHEPNSPTDASLGSDGYN